MYNKRAYKKLIYLTSYVLINIILYIKFEMVKILQNVMWKMCCFVFENVDSLGTLYGQLYISFKVINAQEYFVSEAKKEH